MTLPADDAGADHQSVIAELRAERDAALVRELAQARVLGLINESSGDLTRVFEAIIDEAMTMCGGTIGAIGLYDGRVVSHPVMRGFPAWYQDRIRDGIPVEGHHAFGVMLRGARHWHTRDLIEDLPLLYPDGRVPDSTRMMVEETLVRSALGIPMRKGSTLLGYIGIWRPVVQPFTEKEIAPLESFAAQAAIAMENARLLTEQREALEQQTATAEVLGVINASPGDLQPVFGAMVERAATLCEADEAAVRTFDGSVLNLVAIHGPAGTFEELMRLGPSHPDGLYEPIAKGASVTHVVDVRESRAFRTNARARERLELRGIRTWLAVALRKAS